jgi:hypothetical protein
MVEWPDPPDISTHGTVPACSARTAAYLQQHVQRGAAVAERGWVDEKVRDSIR